MEITKEMDNHPEKYIKFVANYLRKSRGEGVEDLAKHKIVLTELCKKNNWKYVEYAEIESGDSIAVRPIFQKLLKDIEQGLYDAVCVVDIDRLGRGDKGDQDKIQKTFARTNTLIATPTKIYNLINEDDEFVVDMKGFLARREYKMIVKRLNQGKKVGSKRGDWTNGTPPFPYEYERYKDKYNPKGLVVNDEKLKIYRYIIDSVIKDKIPPAEIAWDLNKQGILSPRGTQWHGNTIARLLVDETHLGKIISNKTKGDGHKNKKPDSHNVIMLPKSEWVVVENCHEAVKNQEEHEQILAFLHRRIKAPTRRGITIKPLSGLVKCGLCGHTMNIYSRSSRKTPESIKPCWYRDKYGNQCPNRGGLTTNLYDAIKQKAKEYKEQLQREVSNNEGTGEENVIKGKIEKCIKEINLKEKALDRIHEAYEAEVYSISEFKERKNTVNSELEKLEKELSILKTRLKNIESLTKEDKIIILENFEKNIDNPEITDENKNKLYKSILKNIVWKREKDKIEVKINFL